MKIKLIALNALLGVSMLLSFQTANAITLTAGDSYTLGYIVPGTPPDSSSMAGYVNQLISMSLGAQTTIGSQTYTRSSIAFSPLDTAVFAHDYGTSPTSIDLGAGGFEYITAHYGNNGDVAWYIGGLTGVITISSPYTGVSGNGGGLSGVLAFNGKPVSTPDGGSTIMLLGAALSGLGMVARRLKS